MDGHRQSFKSHPVTSTEPGPSKTAPAENETAKPAQEAAQSAAPKSVAKPVLEAAKPAQETAKPAQGVARPSKEAAKPALGQGRFGHSGKLVVKVKSVSKPITVSKICQIIALRPSVTQGRTSNCPLKLPIIVKICKSLPLQKLWLNKSSIIIKLPFKIVLQVSDFTKHASVLRSMPNQYRSGPNTITALHCQNYSKSLPKKAPRLRPRRVPERPPPAADLQPDLEPDLPPVSEPDLPPAPDPDPQKEDWG